MYGKFFVDNQGDKIFEGEYFESEILNQQFYGKPYPQLYQNHTNCKEEIENMIILIEKIRNMLDLDDKSDCDSELENLDIEIPECVKRFYKAKGTNTGLVTSIPVSLTKSEYYFQPDELYIENYILVFSSTGKRKKKYLGIDLKEKHLMIKDKEWKYEECMESFCELMSEKAVIFAINMMPFHERFRIKGKELSELNPIKHLENKFSGLWQRFEGYYNRYNSILINEECKSIAWLRAGSHFGDILIGSKDKDTIEKFKEINN
ncbi:MAG: hypothetical protein K2G63_03485 [Oscillospiraceae bacterium]|nr:hypothetical protein [Oscillospiraceae bacterium]